MSLDTKVSGPQNSCRYLALWYCYYSSSRPWFLLPKFLVSFEGWLLWPFSVQFQIFTYSPASGHSTASYLPWQICIPDKILGYYMQHTAMDYQLRSEKLLNSSFLPNYEECMAKSHSPELSPTNIFLKCYWHPVRLIITTYVLSTLQTNRLCRISSISLKKKTILVLNVCLYLYTK